ncbi:MAG: STAS domain-containing protein [Mycobacterium sp.]
MVQPKGRLDARSAAALSEQLQGLISDGHHRLVVDMSDVVSIDSAILGSLLAAHKAAMAQSGDLRLTGSNSQVTMVLEITGLNRVLKPFDEPEPAFAGHSQN